MFARVLTPLSFLFVLMWATACSHAPSAPGAPRRVSADAATGFEARAGKPRQPTGTTSFEGFEALAEDLEPIEAAEGDSLLGFYENSSSQAIFDMIRSARQSIDIEIYEMGDPDFIQAIKEAVQRKVQVRIVKDPSPVGKYCDWFNLQKPPTDASCKRQREFLDWFEENNGVVKPFVKNELCGKEKMEKGNCFEHGKMIITDSRKALLSTGNFNSSNLCNRAQHPSKCNRDYSYVTKDPEVIEGLQKVFDNDLAGTRYDLADLLKNHGFSRKVTVSPYSLEPLIRLVRGAKHHLRIQNQYMKYEPLNSEIRAAAERGVKVEMTLSSLCAFGKPRTNERNKATKLFTEMEKSGVRLKFFNVANEVGGRAGYLHAKVLMVDDQAAWIGSVNGSDSALNINREFGIVIQHPDRLAQVKSFLDGDFHNKASTTWQESLDCVRENEARAQARGRGAPAETDSNNEQEE